MSTNDGTPPGNRPVTSNEREQGSTRDAQQKLDIAQQMVEQRILSIKQLEEEKRIIREINKVLGEAYEAQKNVFAQNQISINDYLAGLKAAKDNSEELAAVQKKLGEQFEKSFKGSEEVFKKVNEIVSQSEKTFEQVESELEAFRGELKRAEAVGDDFSKGVFGITKSFGLAAKASDTLTGSIAGTVEGLFKLGKVARGEALKAMTQSVKQATGLKTILFSLADQIIKTAMAFDNSSKALEKQFASYNAFSEVLKSNTSELVKMGHSAADQQKIVSALAGEISVFGNLSKEAQEKLFTNAGTIESFGASATDAGAIIDLFSRGTSMSTVAVSDLTVSLAASAKQFGKSAQTMISDFKSMSESLISYGESAIKVFEGLQKISKETGVTAGNLMSLSNSFDTFSGAAEKAAKLNSLFGTNLSAMGMHTADADERMRMLKESFDATGHSIQNMNRYQKLALKEAAGFTTMGETIKFFGGTLSEAEEEEMALAQAGEDLNATMRLMARDILPLAQQLQVLLADLTANKDVIKAINVVAKTLSEILVSLSTNFLTAGIALVAFKAVGMAVPLLLQALATGTLAWGTATKFLLGGTLALLIIGLVALHKVLVARRSPPFYLLFGIVAAGVLAIGFAAKMTQPGLYALAVASLAVGAAISAVFYTLSMAIDSFTAMFTVLSEGSQTFPAAAGGMYAMSGGLLALGSSGLIAATGISAAVATLGALNSIFSFGGSDLKDLVKAGSAITQMGTSIDQFGSGLEKIKGAAASLKSSIGESMIAATMEGNKMSLVVGKEAGVTTLFKNDTLNIKVDMPTIKMPKPEFRLYIDGKEIDARVEERFNRNFK